jgi:hypothetical protein
MARKVGQIIRRGTRTWLVRVYSGRDVETKKRTYLNQTIHVGLRDAQGHLNKMLSERDRGRKLDPSKQTLNQYLDRWLELCARPRSSVNSWAMPAWRSHSMSILMFCRICRTQPRKRYKRC